MSIANPPPPNWGTDKLTAFLEDFRSNQFATFVHHKQMPRLIAFDQCYYSILNEAVNPTPRFPFAFMARCHSALRSAAGVLMGGQVLEAYCLIRLALENAAYGYYVHSDTELERIWLDRSKSENARKAVKDKFQIRKIKDVLTVAAPKLAVLFSNQYEIAIEYGAHPNEAGFRSNQTTSNTEGGRRIETIYLQGDGRLLDLTLDFLVQVNFTTLSIFQLLYPTRFDLLGVRQVLDDFRNWGPI